MVGHVSLSEEAGDVSLKGKHETCLISSCIDFLRFAIGGLEVEGNPFHTTPIHVCMAYIPLTYLYFLANLADPSLRSFAYKSCLPCLSCFVACHVMYQGLLDE